MTKEEQTFTQLLTEFGNAAFDCGEWKEGEVLSGDEEPVDYETVFQRCEKAKKALIDFYNNLDVYEFN